MQLVTFREQGILRRFRIAPVGAGALLASSILSNYMLTLPTVAIEFELPGALWAARWGNIRGIFLAGHAWNHRLRRARPDRRQRDQHDCTRHRSSTKFCGGASSASPAPRLPLPMLPVWLQRFALFLPGDLCRSPASSASWWPAWASRRSDPEIIALSVSAAMAFFLSQQLPAGSRKKRSALAPKP